MDANQLQELATNAERDFWPPHLGAKTNSEKIQYLAERLREAADMATGNEELIEQINELRTKIDDLERDFDGRIDSLRDDLEKLEAEDE